jgi:HSP20 family protein
MNAFLDKLKNVAAAEEEKKNAVPPKEPKKKEGMLQLDVDILQTSKDITIMVFVPGVKAEDLDISVEEDGDVVTIQGKRDKPVVLDVDNENAKPVHIELKWGAFYRQIVLPQEINPEGAEARINKGLLTLTLPLLKIDAKSKRKVVVGDVKKK